MQCQLTHIISLISIVGSPHTSDYQILIPELLANLAGKKSALWQGHVVVD